MSQQTVDGIPWSTYFGVAIWILWKSRNEVVFSSNQSRMDARSILYKIYFHCHEIIHCTRNSLSTSNSVKYDTILVGWTFPPYDIIKCNIDASVVQVENKVGCGGVFRDCQGRWVHGCLHSLPCSSLVKTIQEMQRNFSTAIIVHVFREANRVADSLADFAFKFDFGMHLITSPPPHVRSLIRDDIVGISFSRRVMS
ncbi:Reverse transcriptase-like [Sesbania bispinosa]|nr:Reverse transcriptase-like [Sesbania bispinosa]